MGQWRDAIARYYPANSSVRTTNDWDKHLPATLCAYRSTPDASAGVSQYKMVYMIEMALPLLGDTGPEQATAECPYEYVEWIKNS